MFLDIIIYIAKYVYLTLIKISVCERVIIIMITEINN